MSTKKHVFGALEKKVFMDILKKYSSIIENKSTDGSTLRAKNVAWDSLTGEYNASPHTTQVTSKQLRRLWMNLKQRQKEALIKERQHHLATGGGPLTSSYMDADAMQVAPSFYVGIDEPIDSDSTESVDVKNFNLDEGMNSQPASNSEFLFIATPQPPLLPQTTTPPPPSITPNIRPSTLTYFQHQKITILEKEYRDKLKRANEIHELDKELLKQKIREAKARADLAELLLRQRRSTGIS